MLTRSARRSFPDSLTHAEHTVTTVAALRAAGTTAGQATAHISARRWRRVGKAIVLHAGHLSREECIHVSLINAGPRALLTAFTAAEIFGLTGWARPAIHLLVPAGARVKRLTEIPIRLHYTGSWNEVDQLSGRPLHALAPALIRAASMFDNPRPAAAILAAGVQQRLVRASALGAALTRAPTTRHRRVLIAAIADIEQGSAALTEIDFVRLCRRNDLPPPNRQAIRTDRGGRRRYLDAEWRLQHGRRVVAEVDGALHLAVRQWWNDQDRQNELVIGGDLVLRFPSVVVRTDEASVIDQLRRALLL